MTVPNTSLVMNNIVAQLPLKLTSKNFTSRRAQFLNLLQAMTSSGMLTDPDMSITMNRTWWKTAPNVEYTHWIWQDKLIFYAILASRSEHIVFVIATATTTFLLGMDKTKQNLCQVTRKMYLKEQLTLLQCGTRSVAKFLYELKTIVDELAIIDSDANEFDMAIPSLNRVGSEFKDITAAIRARQMGITFE